MFLKGLKRGKTFSIKTSSDSNWLLNENSENLYGLNLNIISSWASNLDETWTKDFYLYLVTNSTLGERV
jgi:hypothetical protein